MNQLSKMVALPVNYHAHKSTLTTLKCVFNRRYSSYELISPKSISLSHVAIDWKCAPYLPTKYEWSKFEWSKSYESYVTTLQSNSEWLSQSVVKCSLFNASLICDNYDI